MVDIAVEKGVTLTVDEAKGFLKRMDDEEEFDDVELDAVALACIRCASGYSVDSLSLRLKTSIDPSLDSLGG